MANDRASFEAGIEAALVAVGSVSAAGRSADFALGLHAAGEAIIQLRDTDEAWILATEPVPEGWEERPMPGRAWELDD